MLKKLIFAVIVLFAVAMAIPTQRAKVQAGIDTVMDGINTKLIPRRLDRMTSQIDARFERGEGFPNDFHTWLRLSFSSSEFDPWGNLYYLHIGRRDYTVGSMGPDGLPDTDDDITLTVPTPGGR